MEIKFGKIENAKPLNLEGIGGEKFSVNETVRIALTISIFISLKTILQLIIRSLEVII